MRAGHVQRYAMYERIITHVHTFLPPLAVGRSSFLPPFFAISPNTFFYLLIHTQTACRDRFIKECDGGGVSVGLPKCIDREKPWNIFSIYLFVIVTSLLLVLGFALEWVGVVPDNPFVFSVFLQAQYIFAVLRAC